MVVVSDKIPASSMRLRAHTPLIIHRFVNSWLWCRRVIHPMMMANIWRAIDWSIEFLHYQAKMEGNVAMLVKDKQVLYIVRHYF